MDHCNCSYTSLAVRLQLQFPTVVQVRVYASADKVALSDKPASHLQACRSGTCRSVAICSSTSTTHRNASVRTYLLDRGASNKCVKGVPETRAAWDRQQHT